MKAIVYLLGFAWIAVGAYAVLYTDTCLVYFQRLLTRTNRIWLAMIPAVAGLLLLLGASSTTHSGIIVLIGVLGIVKGALIYFNPVNIFETAKGWMETLSDQGCRLTGIVALVLGTVVISWIQ